MPWSAPRVGHDNKQRPPTFEGARGCYLRLPRTISKKEFNMSRFKDLRRIEDAMKYKNEAELRWALDYCSMRRGLAEKVYTMRKQEKYWRQMESKVRIVIENSN
jgi:hypothetical protein